MSGVKFQRDFLATPPVDTEVDTETVAGKEIQRMKFVLGNYEVDDKDVFATNPMPIDTTPSADMEGGGKVAVGVTAVEVTFTGVTKSILISADIANTGTLYVGKSTVTTAGAYALAYLEAGESLTIEYDDVTNAVYVVASIAAQNFWKGALL